MGAISIDPARRNPQKIRGWQLPEKHTTGSTGGGTVSKRIPQGMMLREAVLNLAFTISTNAALAASSIKAGAEWGLIQSLQFKNGSETLIDVTGEELRFLSMLRYKAPPRPRIAIGGTSTAVDSTLVLPFWDVLARRPFDTALNTSAYPALTMDVTFNTPQTIYNDTSSAFTTTPSLTTVFEYSTGYDGILYECRTQRTSDSRSGSGTNYNIELPKGLHAYRGMLIYNKDSSGNDDPNKISNLRIKSGSTTLYEGPFSALRDQALARSQLSETLSSTFAPVRRVQDSQFSLDNYLFLDFAKDGFLTEAFDTVKLNDLRLSYDSTAAINNLQIVMYELLQIPTQR